jgi:uncharacterized protein YjiS (DUF1127 family)
MSTLIAHRDVAASAVSRSKTRISGVIAGTRSTVGRWFARSRRRRSLREIAERNDFHLLKDIGVSQEEAFREPTRPSGGSSAPDFPGGDASSGPAPVSAMNWGHIPLENELCPT